MAIRPRRRKKPKHKSRKSAPSTQSLHLENLEARVLLDVAGLWDELGYRGATSGGVTWDAEGDPGEAQLVLSSDGDPVVIWTEGAEGAIEEFIDTPVTFDFQLPGEIYARQYGGETLGWWDLQPGGGDTDPIGTGSQLNATSGQQGQIIVAWVNGTGTDSEIYARMWDGSDWVELAGSATGGGISDDGVLNERPDVEISDTGEIFVSYAALHPQSDQREIVVKKLSFDFGGQPAVGPIQQVDLVWTELVNEDVGLFGENATSGMTNDLANSFDAAMALDLENNPVVVWTHEEGSDQMEIYLKRWDGDSWEELGVDSASDLNNDGLSGVSSDAAMSIQPDVHVAAGGDFIVSWVGWNNWEQYDTDGQAGVYVKSLQSGTWFDYDTGSASGAGLAPTQGWFYNPQIDTDSNDNPLITFQGFGADERFSIDRDDLDNPDFESPWMTVYASHFDGSDFQILSDNDRNTVAPDSELLSRIAWMPDALVGPADELLVGFTIRDSTYDPFHDDDEILVQQWDMSQSVWTSYGRGSNSFGNEIVNDVQFGVDDEGVQLALIDFDNNPETDFDVILGKPNLPPAGGIAPDNSSSLFLYDRSADTWSRDADLNAVPVGKVFNIRGEPDAEFNIDGNAVLATLDDNTLLPSVYEWESGNWNLIGGTVAGTRPGNAYDASLFNAGNFGMSVLAGQDGEILLAYVSENAVNGADNIVTRFWDPGVGVWQDAGPDGILAQGGPADFVFYNDYNGFDFGIGEADATLNDAFDGDGEAVTPLVRDEWYVFNDDRPIPNTTFTVIGDNVDYIVDDNVDLGAGDVGVGISGLIDDDLGDHGLGIVLTNPNDATNNVAGRADYVFELVEAADINIEFSYQIDALAVNNDISLYLGIDGTLFDFDRTTPGTIDPVIFQGTTATATAGNQLAYQTVTLDTAVLGLDELAVDQLANGQHTLNFIAVFDGAAAGPLDEQGMVALDNVAVYQRTLSGTVDTFATDPLGTTWTFVPDPEDAAQTTGVHDEDSGASQRGDGALVLTLGDGATATANLRGDFEFDFTLAADTYTTIDLNYQILTGVTIGAGETLNLMVAVDGTDITTLGDIQLTGPGGDSLYQLLSLDAGELLAGAHTLSIRGELSNAAANANGTATVRLDNVVVGGLSDGTGLWTILDDGNPATFAPSDNGGGRNVGPLDDDDIGLDLGGNLHSQLTAPGNQVFTAQFSSGSQGDITISFRYKLVDAFLDAINVRLDGNRFNQNGADDFVTVMDWAGIDFDADADVDWFFPDDDDDFDPDYAFVEIVVSDVPGGFHQLEIELAGAAITGQSDLWIDDLSIVAATNEIVDNVHPIVTIIPTNTNDIRQWAIASTSYSPNLTGFTEGATGPFSENLPIRQLGTGLNNGVSQVNIFEYNIGPNSWTRQFGAFGDPILVPTSTLPVPPASSLPSVDSYELRDLTVGPNGLVWIAVQHAEAEFSEGDDPDVASDDEYVADPFNEDGGSTLLDAQVWRWLPAADPLLDLDAQWVKMFDALGGTNALGETIGTPPTTDHAYTNVLFAGSAGQLPSLSWTIRDVEGRATSTRAVRLESGNVWGVLGISDDINNLEGWGVNSGQDMIVRSDGFPIIAFNIGNGIDYDAVREFRTNQTLPSLTIVENAGVSNDDILDFEPTRIDIVDEAISITNAGPGDLVIYDVQIGGIGTLAQNPFSFGVNTPAFPVTLEAGESTSIGVAFDPDGVPLGDYDAVLLVHHSDPEHPTHEFGHFYEVLLNAQVINAAEIGVSPLFLNYSDTTLTETSETREILIFNEGDEGSQLTIDRWNLDGLNYRIVNVIQTVFATNTSVPLGLTNTPDAADDVSLAFGDTLSIEIVFEPTDIAIFNETLAISSDDTDESIVNVVLSGAGQSGSLIIVEAGGVNVPDEAGSIDFGSVISGQSSVINVTVRNTGITDLTLSSLADNSDFITFPPLADPVVIVPNGSFVIPLTYSPNLGPDDPDDPNDPVPLEDIVFHIFNDSPDTESQDYEINLLGLGVPERPLLSVTDVTFASNVSFLNFGPTRLNAPATQTFAIRNIGGADLIIQSFAFLFSANNPYTVDPIVNLANPLTIPFAGAAEFVDVTFTPTAVTEPNNDNILQITTNDIDQTVKKINLFGSAVNPLLQVTDTEGSPNDLIIDFGELGVNQSSPTEKIVLTNVGQSTVTISNWSLNDPSGVFFIDPFVNDIALEPLDSFEIDTGFIPATNNVDYVASVVITDEPNGITSTVTLSGSGVLPGNLQVSDNLLTFDSDPGTPVEIDPFIVGVDTQTLPLTLTNSGESDLLIKDILIVDQQLGNPLLESILPHTPFVLSPADSDGVIIPAGGNYLLNVTFAPSEPFSDTLQLRITTNDAQDSAADSLDYVGLTGQAVFNLASSTVHEVGDGNRERSLKLLDGQGSFLTIRVTGGGYAVVVQEDGEVDGSNIASIDLIGTSSKSNLIINSSGGTTIGRIEGQTIKNMMLKNVTLDGDMNDDGAQDHAYSLEIDNLFGKVQIGDIVDKADVRIENGSSKGIRFEAGRVEDGSTIHFLSDANRLALRSKVESGGTFVVEGTITRFDAKKARFSGAIAADNITRGDFGWLDGAAISAKGTIGRILTKYDFVDSLISSGFYLGSDGRLGDNGSGGAGDTLFANSLIENIMVKGIIERSFVAAGIASNDFDFFTPSNTASAAIEKIRFGGLPDMVTGSPFGVATSSAQGVVKVDNQTIPFGASQDDFEFNVY
jgi:hypothetical protein